MKLQELPSFRTVAKGRTEGRNFEKTSNFAMSNRPGSAQSRNAWVSNYGNDGIRDDPDLVDSQVYMGGDKNRNASSTGNVATKSTARGGGGGNCFTAIGRGIRCK